MSGKLWIIIADAVFSIAAILVTFIFSDNEALRVLIISVIGVLQPAIVAVIKLLDGIDEATHLLLQKFAVLEAKLNKK